MDQKNIIVGNKMRSVIIIGKKPSTKSGQNKVTFTRRSSTSVQTIKRKKCGGCSRKRKS